MNIYTHSCGDLMISNPTGELTCRTCGRVATSGYRPKPLVGQPDEITLFARKLDSKAAAS